MKSSISLAPLKALLLVIALMAITIAPGCIIAANKKNEKKVEKTYSISEFSAISASAGIKVIYTQGKSTGIAKVTTTESGEKYLVVEVKSGCLKLYYDSKRRGVNINGPTVVTVQSPTLRAVDLSSAASLQANGVINQSAMIEFNLSSAADVTVNTINCDNLQADLSSSASLSVNNFNGTNLTLVGSSASSASFDKVTCKKGTWLHTSSAAGMSINRFTGETLSGEASSGSRITVDNINCKNVDGDASSGASVNLSGKCTMLKKESSSGGSVNTKNLSHSVLSDNTNSYNNAAHYAANAKAAQEAGRKAREEAQKAREEARKASDQARKEAHNAWQHALKEAQVAREEARKAAEQARKEAQIARKEARKAQKKALAANKKAKTTKKAESSDKSNSSNKTESDGFLRIP
ncbi:MAG: DUF2807 domain-containing protein [Muribaculaceae bacterium]|nr:DUF2807 domain-containing protein [Muribaculaceae bacterium]